ncbi:hypothetical protein [Cohnella fermenti]|uniref:DUF3939 domain-containing protein n=1 Tax=Cohnella fermenti TaxID=2565925 RepID=A0A4S4BTH1_9BACL|nr:hypothetical protein [Cohnella fermenti]THF78363.1 hypothetical protein E6C55_14185 [Cohnella fermenti]
MGWNLAKGLKAGKRAASAAAVAVMALALSGCLYPEEQTPGNDPSARQAVLTVTDAVEQYQTSTGLLPIVSADETVPKYEKFKLDLAKLKRMNYLGSIPKVAFENGGKDQFLLIDEETDPQVKLLDIVVYQQASDVQKKVDAYRDNHGGGLPSGELRYAGFWTLDADKLGTKLASVNSMFSGQSLDYMIDENGAVYLDYALDIATAVGKTGGEPAADEDLREYLVDASYYVPVKAPEYRWSNGEPIAVAS